VVGLQKGASLINGVEGQRRNEENLSGGMTGYLNTLCENPTQCGGRGNRGSREEARELAGGRGKALRWGHVPTERQKEKKSTAVAVSTKRIRAIGKKRNSS